MPLIHKRTFRVRNYECDAYGHVNNANYVRYMQEAALDASAAVGYDEARYNELNHAWVIHETNIEYLHPLRFGDSVEVTTWVGDFRRVRSRRFYELRNTETGDMVAQGSTDWVYIDRATQRPAQVPAEMVAAFMPEGGSSEPLPRDPFPEAPPAPSGAFTMHREVEWRDVDPVQHVNNATYLNYMEECGIQAVKAFGWPMTRMQSEHFAIVARRQRVEYRQQAALDDQLAVTTYLSNVKRSNATRHFFITRESDGALIARSQSLWVFINLQTNSIARLPQVMLDAFATHIAE